MVSSASNAVKEDIRRISKSFNEILSGNSHELFNSIERASDMLDALYKFPVGPMMLRETKIGSLINKLLKAYNQCSRQETVKEVSANAVKLLKKWKGVMKGISSETTEAGEKVDKTIDTSLSSLPKSRQTMVVLLTKALLTPNTINSEFRDSSSTLTNEEYLSNISLAIEREVQKLLPSSTNINSYNAKFRSLIINVKKNEILRIDIINNFISPRRLVDMTPQELATKETKSIRQQVIDVTVESRRGDWLEGNIEEIRTNIGYSKENHFDWSDGSISADDFGDGAD